MYKPTLTRKLNGGVQNIYKFSNGYGASVVNHSFSYGQELAVIKFKGNSAEEFDLCYDTDITEDVIGHCSNSDVQTYLKQIEAL